MKKLLSILFAAAAIAAGAMNQSDIPSGGSIVNNDATTLKGIIVKNPGGQYGVSENVTLTEIKNFSYDRFADYVTVGEVGSKIPEKMDITWWLDIVGGSTSYGTTQLVNYVKSSHDPARFHGEVEMYLIDYDSEIEAYTNCFTDTIKVRCTIDTYTDYNSWNVKEHLFVTNILSDAALPIAGHHGEKNWLVKDFTHDINYRPWSEMSRDDGMVIVLTNGIAKLDVSITQTPHTFNYQKTQTFATIPVGTESFVITNTNILLPARTTLRCTTVDSQTKVGIIYE